MRSHAAQPFSRGVSRFGGLVPLLLNPRNGNRRPLTGEEHGRSDQVQVCLPTCAGDSGPCRRRRGLGDRDRACEGAGGFGDKAEPAASSTAARIADSALRVALLTVAASPRGAARIAEPAVASTAARPAGNAGDASTAFECHTEGTAGFVSGEDEGYAERSRLGRPETPDTTAASLRRPSTSRRGYGHAPSARDAPGARTFVSSCEATLKARTTAQA